MTLRADDPTTCPGKLVDGKLGSLCGLCAMYQRPVAAGIKQRPMVPPQAGAPWCMCWRPRVASAKFAQSFR